MFGTPPLVSLRPVDAGSWRDVAGLTVTPDQQRFVAAPTYYLALCAYGDVWHPLAVHAADGVVGFLMWGIDDDDGSVWLGGLLVDEAFQRRGYGRAAVRAGPGPAGHGDGARAVRAVLPARQRRGAAPLRRAGVRRDG